VVKDNPLLSTRLPGGKKGRDPVRVVLDTWLDLPLSARIFSPDEGGATIAACGRDAPAVKAEALEEHGVKVWRLPLHHDRVSLDALAERLGRENILSLLIEGGSEVNAAALLDEKIVDKVLFFYAPKIVGGRGAATLAGGRGLESMEDALPVEIVRVRRLGPDLLVEARPVY
jgi:diaminohydroxyphosphoribosylaminopyrimidine deaminase/5-amino-6-(5-phosphoribosylamino)uracil reductase